jgi:hypothetical protein
MRAGKPAVEEALARPGRYQRVAENLEVKEVMVGEGTGQRRYVVVRNLAQPDRDREERNLKVRRIQDALARLPRGGEEHTKAVRALRANESLGRYVKLDRVGHPVLDRAKLKSEERLDGKYLVVTSDDSLSSADVALGYTQLVEVERAWRSLKSDLDLRPMYHRKAERIRAHVVLCWLALLLVRTIEVRCAEPWPRVRQEMDRLHRGTFEGPNGRFTQCTELSARQRHFFKAAGVTPPRRFQAIEPVTTGLSPWTHRPESAPLNAQKVIHPAPIRYPEISHEPRNRRKGCSEWIPPSTAAVTHERRTTRASKGRSGLLGPSRRVTTAGEFGGCLTTRASARVVPAWLRSSRTAPARGPGVLSGSASASWSVA